MALPGVAACRSPRPPVGRATAAGWLNVRISSGKDERLVPGVKPPHDVRRAAVIVPHLGDHADAAWIVDAGTLKNQPVANARLHETPRVCDRAVLGQASRQ